MAVTFAKAPLIELIAELRWVPQESKPLEIPPVPQQQATPTLFFGGTKQEEFYMRVGGELYKSGFDRSERLIPSGMPFVLHQGVYRFRSESEDRRSVLYQVGYGIFSVHALPPYHSWSKFFPFVQTGVEVLLKCRPEADSKQPFVQVTLRYIDFFGVEITKGQNIFSFVSDVFGISTTLPAAITKAATAKEVKSLFTKVVLPLRVGDLTVSVGDGRFANQYGIVLDSAISSTAGMDPTLDAVMKMFDSSYHVVHDMFFELTRPIHAVMQPQGAPDK